MFRKAVISVFFCILCCIPAVSQNVVDAGSEGGCIPVLSVSEDSLAYRSGERFSFTIHYEWGAIDSDVGWASVSLDTVRFNGERAFHCSVYGRTTRLYDLFFKVREDFQSWFTVEGLKPLKFTRNTREGRYEARNTYSYMWEGQDSTYIAADVFTSSGGSRSVRLPLGTCTYDLPALFYLARNIDMDRIVPDVKYPMTFAIDDDVYNVYFIYRGKERKKVRGFGTVNTMKFSAKLLSGNVFTGDEDLSVWISDDRNRIPVLFEAPILVGVASGRIEDCSGLKYPFTSFVKK